MNEIYIRNITPESAEKVISEIGFDRSYIKQALKKYNFRLYKLCNLSCPQATIIKQLALSVGADAALRREVITCQTKKTDLLIGSTVSQLEIICQKLKHQPFALNKISEEILKQIKLNSPKKMTIRGKIFDFTKKTFIMGVLNVTPDSFSDGGNYLDTEKAIKHVKEMINSGADIIDIGGESTRPFAKEVDTDEELKRVIPVIKKIREFNKEVPLSIDTRHSKVALEAIKSGADMINDVSGLDWDKKMISAAVKTQVPVIIMHSLGNPETMQQNPVYNENVIDSVYKNLCDKTLKAIESGINPENIIIDPGIGFGKTLDHNIEIIKRIEEFISSGFAVMAGVSRKSVISGIINIPPEDRDEATIALNSFLVSKGVNILRVHNVSGHYKSIPVIDKIIKNK